MACRGAFWTLKFSTCFKRDFSGRQASHQPSVKGGDFRHFRGGGRRPDPLHNLHVQLPAKAQGLRINSAVHCTQRQHGQMKTCFFPARCFAPSGWSEHLPRLWICSELRWWEPLWGETEVKRQRVYSRGGQPAAHMARATSACGMQQIREVAGSTAAEQWIRQGAQVGSREQSNRVGRGRRLTRHSRRAQGLPCGTLAKKLGPSWLVRCPQRPLGVEVLPTSLPRTRRGVVKELPKQTRGNRKSTAWKIGSENTIPRQICLLDFHDLGRDSYCFD